MSKQTHLILDCNYLCHLQKHSLPEFQYGGEPTGIIYGFLRYLPYLQREFNTTSLVFCWDSKTSKRKIIFPEYKLKRKSKEYTPEEEVFENAFRHQMKLLRIRYLKKIGFRNVFIQPGYESDDIISSICKWLPQEQNGIIITSDKDLYQCLRSNISIYNPSKRKRYGVKDFEREYGIKPSKWGLVKTIAGCSTDEVPGVRGVGEKTAIKYLTGQLKMSSVAYQNITSQEGVAIANRNGSLVYLPIKGTKVFQIQPDKLSEKGWKQVCRQLGIKSITDKMPFRKR